MDRDRRHMQSAMGRNIVQEQIKLNPHAHHPNTKSVTTFRNMRRNGLVHMLWDAAFWKGKRFGMHAKDEEKTWSNMARAANTSSGKVKSVFKGSSSLVPRGTTMPSSPNVFEQDFF